MTGLQSSVGLISGIDYTSLVEQLIQIDGISKTNLENRNKILMAEEQAISNLMARYLTSSYMITYLNKVAPFRSCTISSSNAAVLNASKNGTPIVGSYTFTPLQVASAQQTVSQGVASDTQALGKTGTITIGKGWSLESSVQLKDINGGAGFTKGSIRITDGSGTRATIDLKKAITMQDVVNAINDNDTIDVTAELVDDHLVLTDTSGGDISKFAVSEVSGGKTAASLGFTGQTADAAGKITGSSIYKLGENMSLSLLNDGNGLVFDSIWPDISVKCKDGSTFNIDFNRLSTTAEVEAGAPEIHKELTVGDLLNTINNAGNGKINARISDDGKGLVIDDLTTGTGFTTLSQVSTPPVFRTLGLISGDSDGGAMSFLSGAAANGNAKIDVKDKAGNTATLEFTQIELDAITSGGMPSVVSLLNRKMSDAGVQLELQMNNAYTGFDIVDKSGGTGSVQFADNSSDLAARLGLANTLPADALAALAGAEPGQMKFTDRLGHSAEIDISQAELDALTDVNDIVTLFNSKLSGSGAGITCQLNDTGDGVKFTDTTGAADILSALSGAEPGQIKFTDRTGAEATIDITQDELDAVASIEQLRVLFNSKLHAAGLTIDCELNTGGGGIQFTDTSGSTASHLKIEQTGTVGNVADSLTERLGIAADVDADEILGNTGYIVSNMKIERAGTVNSVVNSISYRLGITADINANEINGYAFGSMMHGEAVNSGHFETRHLLGGLDTVLMSSVNGGYGFGKSTPGAVEVQDRAGHTATLNFTQAELNSMQTLSDTIRVVNEKLSSAGIGLTVEMNSNKTGLMLNDTTGSTSHNIKFKDITSSTVTSPEVPGVSAVSADDGSGGTAVLTFSQSDLLNGMSFAFTTESETAVPLYNAATKTITFHIPSDIASKTTWTTDDDNALSLMMSAELDFYFRNYGGAPANAPSITGSSSGLAAKAMADAASGGKTKIDASLAGSVEGVTHVPETVSVSNAKIASALGLETDTASSQVSGTSLHRQIISYATKLSDLNGGSGVNLTGGKIYIQDSSGATMTLTIDSKKHQTVGDVLNAINVMSGIKVTARINDNGDGIVLEEYAGGTQSFVVGDADSISTFAKTLGIAGTVAAAQKDPDGRLRINASQTHEIAVEATDTLDDIRKKINDLNVGYNATIVNDGSDTPYRLSISSKTTGAAGGFNIDLSAIGLTTETMSESKDALLAYGDANNSSGLILHSATNTFKEIVNGITLTVTGVSDSPVTVSSASSSTDVLTALKTFVENYNKFREELNTYTYFQVSETSGVQGNELWNSSVAKAFDKQVTDMLLKTVEGIPGIRSLADLGITIRKNYNDTAANIETGKLEFDETKFQDAWDKNQEAVEKFFFEEKTRIGKDGKEEKYSVGWAQKFVDMTNSLVGDGEITGKADARLQVLDKKITENEERIAFLQERLDWKKAQYLKQFYAMEQAMARMSSDMSTVSSIASSWSSNYSSSGTY